MTRKIAFPSLTFYKIFVSCLLLVMFTKVYEAKADPVQIAKTSEQFLALESILIPDVTGDGFADRALLFLDSENNKLRVQIVDGVSLNKFTLITWNNIYENPQLLLIPDLDGDNTAEIGIFGVRNDEGNIGKPQIFTRSLTTGLTVRVFNWPANWTSIKPLVLDDITGDGIADIAIQGRFEVGDRPQLVVRSGANATSAPRTFSYPNLLIDPVFFQHSDVDGDGISEISTFGRIERNNKIQVKIANGTDPDDRFKFYNFPDKWSDIQWIKLDDKNKDGVDDWALFGVSKEDNRPQLIVKDGKDPKGAISIFAWSEDLSSPQFFAVPDMTGDGISEVAVGGQRSNGRYQFQVKDGADRNVSLVNHNININLSNVSFHVLSDLTADGIAEIGFLGTDAQNNYVLQVQNGNGIDGTVTTYNLGAQWAQSPSVISIGDITNSGISEVLVEGTYSDQTNAQIWTIPDIDSDTYPDTADAFPNDKNEWLDTDKDGTGNNADTDDDNDLVADVDDAFPLDASESVDTDSDGVGNNADTDDDNDNVPDLQDAYPLISLGDLVDTDMDGIPDDCDADCEALGMVADEDDDGNGIPDVEEQIQIAIATPQSLITVGTSPVTVSGTVTSGATVYLNGVEVSNNDGTFEGDVALQEGSNNIEARAVLDNIIQTDLITISLDKTPPYLTVDSHENNQTVYESKITITGLVNDIVRGTIEESQANVTVNGEQATIQNRSYSVADVELNQGSNEITIQGADQVGNTASIKLNINYEVLVGSKVQIASGQAQEGAINSVLEQPLTVKVVDLNDAPLQGESVVFRVAQGSGAVGASTESEGRAIVVDTDVNGLASTSFKLGSRSGASNHKVTASVVGVTGGVSFSASAKSEKGNKLSINAGNNQRGVVYNNLPQPFVTVVTDGGANVVSGARVLYSTSVGGGVFANGEKEIVVETDSDGRATAQFRLGNKTGLDSQRVMATLLDGPEGQSITAGFTASAFKPAEGGNTTITGVVLDNQDQPIPNVTVRIEDTSREAITSATGQFTIEQVPVGPVHLIADGSTVTDGSEYPSLSYNLVTISGVANPLPAPIYMVKLDTENAVFAGSEDVSLEIESFPGFRLDIAKDSVTFPDGSKQGLISVTSVNASKVPMAPPNGMQPQFIVTIQPTGAMFDPPARLSLPNVDAHPAGAQVEMYSYDHDLEEFVSIGLGTTSEDGSVIRSNSGVGVIKAGWHCGSQPGGSGCCGGGGGGNGGCGVCKKRDSANCEDGNCVADDSQDPGDCKKCSGGAPVNDDSKKPTGDNAPCLKCQQGSAVADASKNNSKCGTGAKQSCYTCKDGKCGNNCEADPDKITRTLTSGDIGGLDSVAEKLKNAGKILPGPLEVVDASAALSVSGTWESGEKCCTECSEGKPLKSNYEKYQGDYKIEASMKIGLKGSKVDLTDLVPYTYTRIVLGYELGPFLTIKGSLGNSIAYETSQCEEGNCLTVEVAGSLGAQLDVGGSVKIGYDRFDPTKCPLLDPEKEAQNENTKCFGGFKGGVGEAWATGGSALIAKIAVSDCPGGDKCEVGLDKVAGKIFVKAAVDLTFFKYEYENVIAEGTLFEGATASCL